MPKPSPSRNRQILTWGILVIAITVPVFAAAMSPYLAWRQPIYIAAGFAGIAAMVLLLLQPLLVGGYLPGLEGPKGKRFHRMVGLVLVVAVVVHVGGLWITSPPDVIDALTFNSPTPFSAWGVIAMWAVFGAALWASVRRRLGAQTGRWRLGHTLLAVIVVVSSVVHALLIEGTMETISKVALCALALLAMAKVVFELKAWAAKSRS